MASFGDRKWDILRSIFSATDISFTFLLSYLDHSEDVVHEAASVLPYSGDDRAKVDEQKLQKEKTRTNCYWKGSISQEIKRDYFAGNIGDLTAKLK